MALDILVGDERHCEIIAQIGEHSYEIFQAAFGIKGDFPLLQKYFDNYYNDQQIPVGDLEAFKNEMELFCARFLPLDEHVENALKQILRVVDYAIEQRKPIMMYAD